MSTDNTGTCFTMGYSDLPVDAFLYFLRKAGVDTVVDVRSSPYSRYQPQFNREEISRILVREGIVYLYLGDLLGGRHSSPDLLFPDGTVDYDRVRATPGFISGLDRLCGLIQGGKIVSLMCSEKDPLTCHRFVLIGKNLQKRGIEVIHLYPELVRKTHAELEQDVLCQYGLKGQKTLTGDETDSIEVMYERLNKKIGYKTVPQNVDDTGETQSGSDEEPQDACMSGRTEELPKKENQQRTLF